MKRIFALYLLIATIQLSYAQCDSVGKVSLNATVGLGLSHVRTNSDFLIGKRSTIFYQAGVMADYTFFPKFFLESGLQFQHKGYRIVNELGGPNEEDYTCHFYYLHIPVTANYKIAVEKVWLIPQFGPYWAIALAGKQRGFERVDGVEKTYNEKLFGDGRLRRFDFGLRLACNVAFMEKYRLGIGYDLGLVNMYKLEHIGSEIKIKNGSFSISMAYYFY